jgi:hypothetical protein
VLRGALPCDASATWGHALNAADRSLPFGSALVVTQSSLSVLLRMF